MKTTIRNVLATAMFFAVSIQIHAQGTLVYDQQSATSPYSIHDPSVDGLYIQEDSPLMQSFIPTLSAIGFAQLEFEDSLLLDNGTNGATVYVNLWTGSPDINSATLLGSTTPVYMPNGFENGFTYTGVTNFYFSTSIALTPGQTYYLQPVVLSGDDPWPIVTIGDTYPNGRLYGSTGGYFQPSTDFWFREGVVPEPSTLALAGLSCLLAFTFKRRSKLVVLLLFTIPILSVQSAPDSIVQVTADAAGLTPVASTALPSRGTFWVMTNSFDGNLMALPYPFFPSSLSDLPIYSVIGNEFIIDNTGGQLVNSSAGQMSSAQATSTVQAQTEMMAGLMEQILDPTNISGTNGYQLNGFTATFDTNGIWLQASNEDTYLGLRLWNPVSGDNYQLLWTTNLSSHNWNLGQILSGASDYTDFTPFPVTNAMTFFNVHHANPVMAIENDQNSEELNPTNTNDPGHAGDIYIYDEVLATNDLTVYYGIAGTAQNGIDYSNLTGTVTVPASAGAAYIYIDPIDDGLKPNQTIILTLMQNTNYLIDPSMLSATNILTANPQVYPIADGDFEQPCPNSTNNITLVAQDQNNLPLTFSILTYPTHGTLIYATNENDGSEETNVIYTPTNCFEGQDSFTFKVNDGQYDSTPATVNLTISDIVSAYPQSPPPETCRGMSVGFTLNSLDDCGETLHYMVSTPLYGTLTNLSGLDTDPNYVYTPNDTDFTGTDTVSYVAFNDCGNAATNTVAIRVGADYLQPNSLSVLTGTNEPPVAITLSAEDEDDCDADTNYYIYTVTGSLTNGILSGTPPNLTYTPTNGEGSDSFQFSVSDGTWTSSFPGIVNIYTVTGPGLTAESVTCYPFGTAVQLNWSLDTNVLWMVQQDSLKISDYIVYRSTNSGGNYTAIATNADISLTNYLDATAVPGQTNYYVVTFETTDPDSGIIWESPDSNEAAAVGQVPDDLIPPDAIWEVATNVSYPTNLVSLQAPFSSTYSNQYETLYPLPNTYWPIDTTWTNHITLYIPTNVVDLSQVKYSIAIDNDYWLYVNGSYIDSTNNREGPAAWPPFQSFTNSVVTTNVLHWGTNDIVVGIRDRGDEDYFSMVVTTNTCGW